MGPHDFEQGKLKLRCVATISQVYSEGSEELIIGDRGQASGSHPGKNFFKSVKILSNKCSRCFKIKKY